MLPDEQHPRRRRRPGRRRPLRQPARAGRRRRPGPRRADGVRGGRPRAGHRGRPAARRRGRQPRRVRRRRRRPHPAGRQRLAGAGHACAAACRCRAGSARWTWWSRSRCPAGRRGRWAWPPRRPGAAAGCSPSAPPDSPLAEVSERTGGVHVPVPAQTTPAARASRMALWALVTPVVHGRVRARADRHVAGGAGAGRRPAGRARRGRSARRPRRSSTRPRRWRWSWPSRCPVVLGDGDVTGVAASRAVSMLARTARVPAMRGALPDDAGDVVATFGGPLAARPDDVFADPFLDAPTRVRGCGCCCCATPAPTPDAARTGRGWRAAGPRTPSGSPRRTPGSG